MQQVAKYKVKVYEDKRGKLLKIVHNSYVGNKPFGEIYAVVFKGKSVRANHYHKLTTEWFVPLKGKIDLYLENVKTKKRTLIQLDSGNPLCVKIVPYTAHALAPCSKREVILIAYSSKKYDSFNNDTCKYDAVKSK
jgi:dTDP-4-dehydrorhamnose 3,5-epimerase-like enzyme